MWTRRHPGRVVYTRLARTFVVGSGIRTEQCLVCCVLRSEWKGYSSKLVPAPDFSAGVFEAHKDPVKGWPT